METCQGNAGTQRKKTKQIFDDNTDEFFIVSVDGVHCRIQEPWCQPSSGWFSEKFNKARLTHKLRVAIHENKIVWVNGPFPAGQNDIKVFQKPNGLMRTIPEGCKTVGDDGHCGKPTKVSTKNAFHSTKANHFNRCV